MPPNTTTYRLTSECYLIPDPDSHENGSLAYFPLKSLVLRLNKQAVDILTKLKTNHEITATKSETTLLENLVGLQIVNGRPDVIPDLPVPDNPKPTRTMLLVSDRCNLNCLYCYGSADTTGAMMPLDIALATVDFLIENALETGSKLIDVGFHGGGEPTTNWSVLKQSIEYAKQQTKKHNLKLSSSICTNGIMSEEKARWIVENIRNITVSIDGPPDIQNFQRPTSAGYPSYDHVAATLDIFDELEKSYAFRITATHLNQDRMVDIYEHLTERFNPSMFCIEPLFLCGRCETSDCHPPDQSAYVKGIKHIINLSGRIGIPVQYSGGRLEQLGTIFCGASRSNFFVTTDGLVTSCVEVSSYDDPRSNIFIYGRFDQEKRTFSFDQKIYQNLVKLRVHQFESCRDCFARWHCAGDCLAKAPDMTHLSSERNEYRCKINKEITLHQLLLQLHPDNQPENAGDQPTHDKRSMPLQT